MQTQTGNGQEYAGRRALVVDDQPLVCESLKMFLEFDGFEVETAGSGPEALRRFEPGRFDLVFTDFNMPEMNGHELASIIKAREPRQPVVMITGYADLALAEEGLPQVDVVLGKPVSLADLRQAISKALNGNGAVHRSPRS